jgi:hypothetical protein
LRKKKTTVSQIPPKIDLKYIFLTNQHRRKQVLILINIEHELEFCHFDHLIFQNMEYINSDKEVILCMLSNNVYESIPTPVLRWDCFIKTIFSVFREDVFIFSVKHRR